MPAFEGVMESPPASGVENGERPGRAPYPSIGFFFISWNEYVGFFLCVRNSVWISGIGWFLFCEVFGGVRLFGIDRAFALELGWSCRNDPPF